MIHYSGSVNLCQYFFWFFTSTKVEIYNDTVATYDRLPAKTYIIRFAKLSGFYLDEYSDIDVAEDRIYGNHVQKAQKVLRSFGQFGRNLGVILSGNKGIGKSLFARLLSGEALKNDIPVIIVDKYISGIASYIETIDQNIMVLFDEFDKTFGDVKVPDGEVEAQAALLGLFDGITSGKKLFVITCNDIRKLSDFIVNRPGRFHYHFRFEYPSAEEIKTYLYDKLDKSRHSEIEHIIAFSRKVDLNYDCLRAIAFEINNGESFQDAISDLNIINLSQECYDITIYFKNGSPMSVKNKQVDVFIDEEISMFFSGDDFNEILTVGFWIKDSVYDVKSNCAIISADKLKISYDEDYEEVFVEKIKELVPDYLAIKKVREKSLHYAV
ncbi:hypothetical protein C804_04964 [Lachnospiraceae bacterium A4]|jgi:hypothetical protein|nr:hypothetical protein C804_04964 [Lachnospiraceae bacterium A4]